MAFQRAARHVAAWAGASSPYIHGQSMNFCTVSVEAPSWIHGGPRRETPADTPERRSLLARSVSLSPRFGWERTWIPAYSIFSFPLLPLDAHIHILPQSNTFGTLLSVLSMRLAQSFGARHWYVLAKLVTEPGTVTLACSPKLILLGDLPLDRRFCRWLAR